MPFASQNTVAITLPADGHVLNFFVLGTQALPTDDSELYSLAYNNEPKVLHTDAVVAICSSLRDLSTHT